MTEPSLKVLETARLILRRFTPEDAGFMLGLLNEPSFIANIGDRGVRTIEQARQFLIQNHLASYERHGYGHYLIELKDGCIPIGTCGLIYREALGEVDVGYALLPTWWSQGYAFEAASAVMAYGRGPLGLKRIVAVVSPGNTASIRVLEKLGLRYAGPVRLAPEAETISLFA